jgi:hypothetical protein
MILQTDLIPHHEFHKGIWLSNKQVPWYFFVKQDRDFKIPNNKNFYNSVDEDILPIVKKLHKNRIPTTPSCAGHFENEKYYSDVYNLLKNFEKRINDEVVFHNEENDKRYRYRNKNFELPWDKSQFLDKILDYQKKGVLGFKDQNKTLFKNMGTDGFSKKHDNGITIVFVNSETPKDCYYNWKSVGKELNRLID